MRGNGGGGAGGGGGWRLGELPLLSHSILSSLGERRSVDGEMRRNEPPPLPPPELTRFGRDSCGERRGDAGERERGREAEGEADVDDDICPWPLEGCGGP